MPLLSSNLALAVHQSPNVHGSREHDDTEFVKVSCVCVREKEGEREKERKNEKCTLPSKSGIIWRSVRVPAKPSGKSTCKHNIREAA